MSLIDRLFGKGPRELFLDLHPEDSHWRVVTWNFDLDAPEKRQWTVELVGDQDQIVHWEKKDWDVLRFFRGKDLIKKRNMGKRNPELISLMNLAIHGTLKFSIENNYEFMTTPVSGATALDMQNEARALQWIQASFETLNRALESLKNSPDKILTSACFAGKTPETDEDVLRLIIFNLDIFFYLRRDFSLQIVIFDDKNQGHGSSRAPAFQQIIKVTKPQFYDEITKLVHRIAQLGEIH